MKLFVMSDVHIDFYIDLWQGNEDFYRDGDLKEYETVLPHFERFYNLFMKPADGLVCAGDIANDEYNHINWLKFIATKYADVYVVDGNHDLTVSGHTFGNGNPHTRSEERIQGVRDALADSTNVHFLGADPVNGIAGCMGMCDFKCGAHISEYDAKMMWFHWYDGRAWRYFISRNTRGYSSPQKAWDYQYGLMKQCIANKPKIMVTHFCPIEMGVNKLFESSSSNAFFYFNAKELLDQMEDGSYWICGHTHYARKTDYVTPDGKTIHIVCMPRGYPGEDPFEMDNITPNGPVPFTDDDRYITLE